VSHLLHGSPVLNGRILTKKRVSRPAQNTPRFYADESYSNYSQLEEPSLKRGVRVFHETFGEGRVLEVAGQGDKAKAMVDFQKFGRKSLMLKFANLKLL
jgi:hypothetical protein